MTGLGLGATAVEPSVLAALSPHWIVLWFAAEPRLAFLSLGGVVLATAATIIAPEAVISGSLPVGSPGDSWHLLPVLRVVRSSALQAG